MRDRKSGFTLVELMITVAVIAILAVIALPSFFGESRKTRALSEVQPMFSDLRVRLEQYLQENGVYPPAPGEDALHPAAPSTTRRPVLPLPASWDPLKLRISGNDEIYCSYTWVTGNLLPPPAPAPPVGPQATAFGFAAPTTSWYYLLAKCDMDGDNSAFSWYFTNSTNPAILKLNEGK